uniref:Uncharacterized protein n=1 Tax=Anguilla anguilla TaxID=7936 RepID=A0A0E9Q022_ANGAN
MTSQLENVHKKVQFNCAFLAGQTRKIIVCNTRRQMFKYLSNRKIILCKQGKNIFDSHIN